MQPVTTQFRKRGQPRRGDLLVKPRSCCSMERRDVRLENHQNQSVDQTPDPYQPDSPHRWRLPAIPNVACGAARCHTFDLKRFPKHHLAQEATRPRRQARYHECHSIIVKHRKPSKRQPLDDIYRHESLINVPTLSCPDAPHNGLHSWASECSRIVPHALDNCSNELNPVLSSSTERNHAVLHRVLLLFCVRIRPLRASVQASGAPGLLR